MLGALTPSSIAATAEPRRPVPFSFGPRFFLFIALGFLWLIPMWWAPSLLALFLLWNLAAIALFLFDLLYLPQPSTLTLEREWIKPLILARSNEVRILVTNRSRIPLKLVLVDQTPTSFREQPPVLRTELADGAERAVEYPILPCERGSSQMGKLFVRYRSRWSFAERWAVAPLSQTVSVFPDLLEAQEQALYVLHTRHPGIERRRRHDPGFGREFESLREYREGDELRDVSWTATARRRQLITRTYSAERSQTVWIVVDAGRLLRAQIRNRDHSLTLSKLDYAVNAALSLVQVALLQGDRAGLLAYGRSVQQMIAPGRGQAHLRQIVESLAEVQGEASEANHARAARTLAYKQSRRALVVWLTDFAETIGTPDVIETVSLLARRHLVLFAAISQPDLAVVAREIPRSETDMFRQAAAVEIADRRDVLLKNLRQTGVLALELSPGAAAVTSMTGTLVNEYLRIKDRSLI